MDVRLPDGTIVQNVPDNMTKAELTNRLVAAGYSKSLGGTAPDPTSPNPFMRALEGVGQGMNQIYQGVQQRLGNVSAQDVEETRRIDAPLMDTKAGLVGSVIGQAAPAIGLSMIPGANTLAGSAAIGGLMGAATPTAEGEDVGSNVVKSGLFSVGGQMLGKALTGPIRNRNAPPRQDLIDLAQSKYGIDLPASTRTGNKPLAYLESQLAASPGGGRMADIYQRGNEQFARAVMGEAGAKGELATQAGLNAAKSATQSSYQQLWSNNVVKADNQLLNDLTDAMDTALRGLTPEKSRVVQKQIDNILSKVDANGSIDGSVYQMFLRPEVRSVASGDSSLKAPLKMVQQALDNAAFRSISGADLDALKRFNYQYAVQKKLAPSMGPAEARGGTFTPSAVKVAAGDMNGNVGELAKIGQLLREPPQSGTAPRALAQYMLTGAPAAAYGYNEGGSTGAATGAMLGLLAPFAASRVLASKPAQNYIAKGLLDASPKQEEMIAALLRSGAIPLPALIDAPRQ